MAGSQTPQDKPQAADSEKKDKGPGLVEEEEEIDEPVERFPPEEEARLVAESNQEKSKANTLFTSGQYTEAIEHYTNAISSCPHYLHYELAVLQSNVAACYLKLEEWKDAIKFASDSLKGLKRVDKEIKASEEELQAKKSATTQTEQKDEDNDEDDVEEEIISSGAQQSGAAIVKSEPTQSDAEKTLNKRREDADRIRAKALMRRARAKSQLGGWANLSGAEEDYKELSGMKNLGLADKKLVQGQLRDLPARTKEAQEKEMGEMWGKLKDLGNGLLKPFGLSTENFNMVKDPNTGGYSMNFSQDPPTK